jgi:hypothetical protein
MESGRRAQQLRGDPPNATLSVYESGHSDNTLTVVEISHPVIDGNDLVYAPSSLTGNVLAMHQGQQEPRPRIAAHGPDMDHEMPSRDRAKTSSSAKCGGVTSYDFSHLERARRRGR